MNLASDHPNYVCVCVYMHVRVCVCVCVIRVCVCVQVLCIITAPVSLIIQSNQDATYAFMTVATLLGCFLSMGLIFAPKVKTKLVFCFKMLFSFTEHFSVYET